MTFKKAAIALVVISLLVPWSGFAQYPCPEGGPGGCGFECMLSDVTFIYDWWQWWCTCPIDSACITVGYCSNCVVSGMLFWCYDSNYSWCDSMFYGYGSESCRCSTIQGSCRPTGLPVGDSL